MEAKMSFIYWCRALQVRIPWYHEFVTRINLDHVDKICEVLECDISDLIEYVPNQHKITGKDLIVEEHGNRKPKKKQ